MKIIQKIALRIGVLIGLMFFFNYIYSIFLFEKDLQKHSPIINLVRDLPHNADILYIGESSNFTYSPNDADKRSISSFIGDHYPTLVVADITKQATHAGIYKTLLKEIPKKSSVKTVIVTMNLRSFNADWTYSVLETSLQKSMVLLQDNPPLYNRILLSFKGYDVKSKKERSHQVKAKWERDNLTFPKVFPHKNVREWDDWMAATGIKDSLGIYDSIQTDLACHFIKTYAFQIDTLDHPRIGDFNEIITLAKKRGWNLVFNLLAENTEKAQELVGDDLVFLMNQNRKLLVDYFSNKGILVVDNLNSIKDALFIDRTWTTEHYLEEGRQQIAKNVSRSLLKFYPKKYTAIDYQKIVRSKFFFDFEESTPWDQIAQLSKEESYSGRHSSKTGPSNKYSLTFTYPFSKISDSLKNSIAVSLMAKSTHFEDGMSLVMEIKGERIAPVWMSVSLNKLVSASKKWQKVKHTFILDRGVEKGELVSVYLLNTSKQVVYIDDLGIEFR